jgi:hypothetical protein
VDEPDEAGAAFGDEEESDGPLEEEESDEPFAGEESDDVEVVDGAPEEPVESVDRLSLR